jgi:chromosome segregation ATPase
LKYLNKLPPKTPDTSAKKEYSPHHNLTCTEDREKRLLTELREKERELGDSRRRCEEMRDSSNRLKVSVLEWKEKCKGLEESNRALERSLAQRQRQWLQS